VLLKNDGDLLPLSAGTGVALLGPNADRGQVQGGGSARVRTTRPSMPLAALQGRGVAIVHEPGCRIDKRLQTMRGEFRVRYTGVDGATADAVADRLTFIWMDDPAPGIRCRLRRSIAGSFIPDVTGDWQISLTGRLGKPTTRSSSISPPQTGGRSSASAVRLRHCREAACDATCRSRSVWRSGATARVHVGASAEARRRNEPLSKQQRMPRWRW
jgi:hypothetical protein